MKNLKISDDIHENLTSLLGELTAQTSKMQTYQDAINALIDESVVLPPELLMQTQNFIEENRQMGFTTKEEFIRDAIRFRLSWLERENECVEIPREQYEKLNDAVKEMSTPYQSAENFITSQVNEALEKYEEWKRAHKKR
jgi:Arc/MetJ-type ribon-helix-helix transcriptional regulator